MPRPPTRAASLTEELIAAERHVRHIERLVDDLLDVSRLSHGKVRLVRRPARLGEIVESVAGSLKSRTQHVRVQRRDDPAEVYVDPDRLKQVLSNLPHNASKFSPMSATIEVAYALQGELAVVEVIDTGDGIEASELVRLFEPFQQHQQSLDRAQGGLGLGLAVVKALVELHGGQVSAISPGLGQGTRVRVTIPKGEPTRHSTGETARAGESSTNAAATRVMLIDDNEDPVPDDVDAPGGPRTHRRGSTRRQRGAEPGEHVPARHRVHRHRPARAGRVRGGAPDPGAGPCARAGCDQRLRADARPPTCAGGRLRPASGQADRARCDVRGDRGAGAPRRSDDA